MALFLLFIPYYCSYQLFKIVLGRDNRPGIPSAILSLVIITPIYYYLLTNLNIGCGNGVHGDVAGNNWKLAATKGKVLISVPDTLPIFKEERAIVRIAKRAFDDNAFFKIRNRSGRELIITDTILLHPRMRVELKEGSSQQKVELFRLNNHAVQVIDTNYFNEWTYSIRAVDYGNVSLVVSISGVIKGDLDFDYIDLPVYEKKVFIAASNTEKFRVYWKQYYWTFLILVVGLFAILYRLIPKQIIIDYYMANSKKTNFWNAGALGLVVYLITIASLIVFKIVDISLAYVPLVFVGTILIYTVFTAVSLRDNDKVSEENFLKLMTLAFKKLPPLNLIFRDKKSEIAEEKKQPSDLPV